MKTIRLILLLLLAGACGACHRRHAAATPPALRLEVFTAQSDTLPVRMQFIGQTSANYQAVIQPRVSGYLVSKNYRNGMPVRKGQLIFTIDPGPLSTQLATAEANLRAAQAQEIEARNNYNRAVPLARINAISQSQLDQYTAVYQSARSSVNSAQEALRNARLQVGYTEIRAPIDGIIGHTAASVGDYVGVGTKYSVLNTISNIDTVSVALSIPVPDYLRLRPADAGPSYNNADLLSNIRLILSDGSAYPFQGVYSYTKQDAGNRMGTLIIVVNFPNPDHLLKAGLYAKVTADVGRALPRVVVPQRCVVQSQGVDALWVVRPDSSVEFRKVELGAPYDTLWVISKGLAAGEEVLTEGLQKIRSGEKIVPLKN